MRFPVSTQHIQGCNRKRYHSVFGPFAAMDMNEHPVAVDVAHFQVERLLETKTACIDSEEIGVVVGSSHRGEEFYDLLFGEDGGKNIRTLSFQVTENVPLTMQDLLEKEFEGTVADPQSCS